MQQANVIHIMIPNKYEPQQKHRLGTVSKNYWGGGLNRFYGIPTSPSASIMAQNIQLFGLREGLNTHIYTKAPMDDMAVMKWYGDEVKDS